MSQGQTLMLKRHGMVRLTFLFNNDNKITEIPIIRIRPNKAQPRKQFDEASLTVSYTHLRAHETGRNLVCRLLLEKKK